MMLWLLDGGVRVCCGWIGVGGGGGGGGGKYGDLVYWCDL